MFLRSPKRIENISWLSLLPTVRVECNIFAFSAKGLGCRLNWTAKCTVGAIQLVDELSPYGSVVMRLRLVVVSQYFLTGSLLCIRTKKKYSNSSLVIAKNASRNNIILERQNYSSSRPSCYAITWAGPLIINAKKKSYLHYGQKKTLSR